MAHDGQPWRCLLSVGTPHGARGVSRTLSLALSADAAWRLTVAPGPGSPHATYVPGLGSPHATSAPGLGSPHATSAPGLGSLPPTSAPGLGSIPPHLHRDTGHLRCPEAHCRTGVQPIDGRVLLGDVCAHVGAVWQEARHCDLCRRVLLRVRPIGDRPASALCRTGTARHGSAAQSIKVLLAQPHAKPRERKMRRSH